MIWYEVRSYHHSIETVEVVKETTSFITIRSKSWDGHIHDSRTAKKGLFTYYYPTFAEAKAAVIDRLTRGIEGTRRRLAEMEQDFVAARAMQESDIKAHQ